MVIVKLFARLLFWYFEIFQNDGGGAEHIPLRTSRRRVFFEKHNKNEYMCRPDKNYYYFSSLIVGSINTIKVSKNTSCKKLDKW